MEKNKGKEIVKKNVPFLDTSVLDSDSEDGDTRDIDERIFFLRNLGYQQA